MIIHQIKDLSNEYVISLLIEGLVDCGDPNLDPRYSNESRNLFYKLNTNRYENGCYLVLENNQEFIGSGGWYQYEKDIALCTRLYFNKNYRQKNLVSYHMMPIIMEQTVNYPKVWISFNDHNKGLYDMFCRFQQNKKSSLGFKWGEVFTLFKPIGIHRVNKVDQYIVEFNRDSNP